MVVVWEGFVVSCTHDNEDEKVKNKVDPVLIFSIKGPTKCKKSVSHLRDKSPFPLSPKILYVALFRLE